MRRLISDIKWIPASVIALALITWIFSRMDSAALVSATNQGSWLLLVNLNHNGFHAWRVDHITTIASRFFSAYNFAERPIIGIYLIFFGTFIFLIKSDPRRNFKGVMALLGALLALSFIFIFTGVDPVVIGAVAWLPLMAIAANATMTAVSPQIGLMTLLFLVSFEASYSANQVALISCGTALWLAYLLSLANPRGPHRIGLTCLVALTPAIFVTLTAPMPEIPNYPKSAHVLPFDGVYGTLRPLIGPTYPFDVLDRAALRTIYDDRSLAILLLSIFAWWVRRRHQSYVARYTAKVGLVLALLATLNTCLPEPWATISPLPSLSRLIPWGTCYSVTSVALGLAAWMTVTSLVLNTGALSLIPLLCTGVLVVLTGSPTVFSPLLRRVDAVNSESLRPLLSTPSAVILRSLAESSTDITKQLESIRQTHQLLSRDIRDLEAEVQIYPTSVKPEIATASRDMTWRWSTHTGAQTGIEVLTIRFKEPLVLHGIELDPGPYFTDYPRGLRITGGPCDQSSAPTIVDYPVWQGSLHTLHRGVPYFSPRNEVKAVFPAPVTAQCLFIYQTGKAAFDWSISRIRILG
jgi:hypothetical protein